MTRATLTVVCWQCGRRRTVVCTSLEHIEEAQAQLTREGWRLTEVSSPGRPSRRGFRVCPEWPLCREAGEAEAENEELAEPTAGTGA